MILQNAIEVLKELIEKHVLMKSADYRYKRRVKDMDLIWAELVKTYSEVHTARAAFHFHMLGCDHWRRDYTAKEIHMFARSLTCTSKRPSK